MRRFVGISPQITQITRIKKWITGPQITQITRIKKNEGRENLQNNWGSYRGAIRRLPVCVRLRTGRRRWKNMTTNLPTNYPALLGEIKQRIRAAQYEALKAVNKELIALKNSHQWCEKLAGLKTSSFLKSARMIWSVSFTSA